MFSVLADTRFDSRNHGEEFHPQARRPAKRHAYPARTYSRWRERWLRKSHTPPQSWRRDSAADRRYRRTPWRRHWVALFPRRLTAEWTLRNEMRSGHARPIDQGRSLPERRRPNATNWPRAPPPTSSAAFIGASRCSTSSWRKVNWSWWKSRTAYPPTSAAADRRSRTALRKLRTSPAPDRCAIGISAEPQQRSIGPVPSLGCARGRHRRPHGEPDGVLGATDDDARACLVLLEWCCKSWSATCDQALTPSRSPARRSSSILLFTMRGALGPYQARQARAYMCAASSLVTGMPYFSVDTSTTNVEGFRSGYCRYITAPHPLSHQPLGAAQAAPNSFRWDGGTPALAFTSPGPRCRHARRNRAFW